MNSGLLTYQLPTFTGLLRHSESDTPLLRDWSLEPQRAEVNEVDVQVRSGDYFVTLATMLDSLASDIDAYHTRAQIEEIVSDLIYLQDNYSITKNNPTGTQ